MLPTSSSEPFSSGSVGLDSTVVVHSAPISEPPWPALLRILRLPSVDLHGCLLTTVSSANGVRLVGALVLSLVSSPSLPPPVTFPLGRPSSLVLSVHSRAIMPPNSSTSLVLTMPSISLPFTALVVLLATCSRTSIPSISANIQRSLRCQLYCRSRWCYRNSRRLAQPKLDSTCLPTLRLRHWFQLLVRCYMHHLVHHELDSRAFASRI